jgi:hypothetical protein
LCEDLCRATDRGDRGAIGEGGLVEPDGVLTAFVKQSVYDAPRGRSTAADGKKPPAFAIRSSG